MRRMDKFQGAGGWLRMAVFLPGCVVAAMAVAPNSASAEGPKTTEAVEIRDAGQLFAQDTALPDTVLASQRGGTSFAVPISPSSSTSAGSVILWDELKTQVPQGATPAPGTQSGNHILAPIIR